MKKYILILFLICIYACNANINEVSRESVGKIIDVDVITTAWE